MGWDHWHVSINIFVGFRLFLKEQYAIWEWHAITISWLVDFLACVHTFINTRKLVVELAKLLFLLREMEWCAYQGGRWLDMQNRSVMEKWFGVVDDWSLLVWHDPFVRVQKRCDFNDNILKIFNKKYINLKMFSVTGEVLVRCYKNGSYVTVHGKSLYENEITKLKFAYFKWSQDSPNGEPCWDAILRIHDSCSLW